MPVRYFVLHEMPFENDGVISWELLTDRINSDLANTLGNLVNRTISMSNKYFGGVVCDKDAAEAVDEGPEGSGDRNLCEGGGEDGRPACGGCHDGNFLPFQALHTSILTRRSPGFLAKDEAKKDRLSTVLYNLVESITIGASLLEPYMPGTAANIAQQLNAVLPSFEECGTFGHYVNGTKVTEEAADPVRAA